MPTPVRCDGFEHRTISALRFGVNDGGILNGTLNVAGLSINTTVQRTGAACMVVAQDAVGGTYGLIGVPAANRVEVVSIYVRFETLPTGGVRETFFFGVNAAANFARLVFNNATNNLAIRWDSDAMTDLGAVVADTWYRIDMKVDSSANPWIFDAALDGGTNFQVTKALAAADIDDYGLGGNVAAEVFTTYYDDLVESRTATDYPLGAHKVFSNVPDGAGTDSNPGNLPITGATTAWEAMDEWPADTTTYVAETNIGTGDYREVTFGDTAETTIWGVVAVLAGFSAAAEANHGSAKIVYSDNTLALNLHDADMSETALHYRLGLVAVPGGGWTQAAYNGLKGRVGFSSDATPDPQWSALMLEYAVPEGAVADRPLPAHVLSQAVQHAANL